MNLFGIKDTSETLFHKKLQSVKQLFYLYFSTVYIQIDYLSLKKIKYIRYLQYVNLLMSPTMF